MGFTTPKTKLNAWFPDNPVFWKNEGIQIAYRNLAVSMPNLLLGFAIWLMWSIIVVRVQQVHDKNPDFYRFVENPDWDDKTYSANLYNLPAIAGLAGGTFRIPNSFMIMPLGGRLVVSMTTLLLAIPCLIAYAELSKTECSYNMLITAAFFSGVGGGAFASSMVSGIPGRWPRGTATPTFCLCAPTPSLYFCFSLFLTLFPFFLTRHREQSNISFFFPKAQQGLALGLNAGIGNLGVSLSQVFCRGRARTLKPCRPETCSCHRQLSSSDSEDETEPSIRGFLF